MYLQSSEKSGIDRFTRHELERLNFKYEEEQAYHPEIYGAFNTASKQLTGHFGVPDFMSQSGSDWFVFENKKTDKMLKCDDGQIILDDAEVVSQYAMNGAIHYGLHLLQHTGLPYCFVVAGTGDYTSHKYWIACVTKTSVIFLHEVYRLDILDLTLRQQLKAMIEKRRLQENYYVNIKF